MRSASRHVKGTEGGNADSAGTGTATRWCIVLGLLVCLVCVQGVSAYVGKAHWEITKGAMLDEGLDVTQVKYAVAMNYIVDYISYAGEADAGCPPFEWAFVLNPAKLLNYIQDTSTPCKVDALFVPNPHGNSDDIQTLFSGKAHFQGYKNYQELNQEWVRLQEQTYRQVKEAERAKNKKELVATLGMSLHTVQDFYAHSTWVEWTEDERLGYVTWFEVEEARKKSADTQLHSLNHEGIHKDFSSRPGYDTSYREAYYASRQWIGLVRSWVSREFWEEAFAYGTPEDQFSGYSLYNLYPRTLWYTGTWDTDNSKSTWSLVQYLGVGWKSTFDNPAYRDQYALAEDIGSIYLYNQDPFTPTPEAHPEELDIVFPMRWLKITTLSVRQTDPDSFPDEDIDMGDQADFYSVVRALNRVYMQAPIQDQDTVSPYWVENIPVDPVFKEAEFEYILMDDDFGRVAGGVDDLCDINPLGGNQKSLFLKLNTSIDYAKVTTNGIPPGEDKGDDDEAEVVFTYEFIPPKDITPPHIVIIVPKDGAMYNLNSELTAFYTCTDPESGIYSCSAPHGHAEKIPTDIGGEKTFTVTAMDKEGNVAEKTSTYYITFGGISVTSDPPGATVDLDGAATGKTTPTTIPMASVGEHTVRVSRTDYLTREQKVTVMNGSVTPVHITLVPEKVKVTADTYVDSGYLQTNVYGKKIPIRQMNYGTGTASAIVRGRNVARSSFLYWQGSLVKVDLPKIPASHFSKATLNLYHYNTNGEKISVHRMKTGWVETQATFEKPGGGGPAWSGGWENGVNFVSGATSSTSVTKANTWYSWDVTSDVKAFLSGTPNHGWFLKSVETLGSDSTSTAFTSREGTPANRPYLEFFA